MPRVDEHSQCGWWQGQLRMAQDAAQCEPGPNWTAAVDAATAHLLDMQEQGRLPGRLFGRVSDLAHISHPAAVAAVNAVLAESCSLVSGSSRIDGRLHVCMQLHLIKRRMSMKYCRMIVFSVAGLRCC